MRVLITGASGIIGSSLLSFLTKEFHNKNSKYIFDGLSSKDIDFTNLNDVRSFINNNPFYDIIIFLVGLAHFKGVDKDYSNFNAINYLTLKNLLLSAQDINKVPSKIIFASTISIYGEKISQEVYDESSSLNPISPYAVTKLKAETFLKQNFPNKIWILRFAPVYSAEFLLNIIRRTRIGFLGYRVGSGKNQLSLCHIDNISLVIKEIIKNNIPADIYNISDKDYYTYNDLLSVQNQKFVLRIPKSILKLIYKISNSTNFNFLKENIIKLITNNIYPSTKIRSYVDLSSVLTDLRIKNDI